MFGRFGMDSHGRRLYLPQIDFPPVRLDDVDASLRRAEAVLRALDAALDALPPESELLFARHEAVESSAAEGTTSTLSETLVSQIAPRAVRDPFDARIVLSGYHGYRRLRDARLSPVTAARAAHGLMFPGDAAVWLSGDMPLGRFKTVPNATADEDMPGGLFFFAPPEEVAGLMRAWARLMTAGEGAHPLVTQALAHWLFLHIHPFADGNARVGRQFIPVMLRRAGLSRRAIAFTGEAVRAAKADYVEALKDARRTGRFDGFVRHLCLLIEQTGEANLARARALADLRADWRIRLAHLRGDAAAHVLADVVLARPVLNVAVARNALGGTSFNTANAALLALADAGILSLPSTGRNRLFLAPAVLALFERLRGANREETPIPV
jgi:Fic family protein